MNDIIWITYKGRRIPIKPGMKGKFNKRKEAEELLRKNANKAHEIHEKTKKQAIKNEEGSDTKYYSKTEKDWNNRNTYIKGDTIEYDTKYPLGLSENWKQGEVLEVKNDWASHGDTSPDKIYKVRDLESGRTYEISAGAVSKRINNGEGFSKNVLEEKKAKTYMEATKKLAIEDYKYTKNWLDAKSKYYELKALNNVNLKSLSDYEQYFISQGYGKATALKMAKEIIAQRKRD